VLATPGSPSRTPHVGQPTGRAVQSWAGLIFRDRSGAVHELTDRVHRLRSPSSRPNDPAVATTTSLRQRYEAEVRALARRRNELEAEGWSVEEIARDLHDRRRRIGLRYKLRTPLRGPRGQLAIYRRNWRKYGDILGPSIVWLRQRGRTWDDICDSACRTDGSDLR
jgi:hypothetical protein